ncbi:MULTISPECIES: hypothetical protein [Aeromonas]|uniref:hypothetical protein n=1 Tax=Aeromonas TaxID=642 RepID=UPI000F7881B5|nr:hypothetical protein [Aeromonas salmonicida]RSM32271.1 hypothetical protein C5B78_00895 [Aeromonas salmonicida]
MTLNEAAAKVDAEIQAVTLKMNAYSREIKRDMEFSMLRYNLSKEGYTVPDCCKTLVNETLNFNELNTLTKAILDDKTGLTAAMYGITLEDE